MEQIGQTCKDGGKCHHHCATTCFRKDGCAPLSGSGLNDQWETPEEVLARLRNTLTEADVKDFASGIRLSRDVFNTKVVALTPTQQKLNYAMWSISEFYQHNPDGLRAIEECRRLVTNGELVQPPGKEPAFPTLLRTLSVDERVAMYYHNGGKEQIDQDTMSNYDSVAEFLDTENIPVSVSLFDDPFVPKFKHDDPVNDHRMYKEDSTESRSNGMHDVTMNRWFYRGFTISPKLDMGSNPMLYHGNYVKSGFVVTRSGCNVLPGAGWGQSIADCKLYIDLWIESEYNGNRFHELMKPYCY